MSTETRNRPTQESQDAQAILEHVFKGKPVDPDVSKRVRARAEIVREELRNKGVTNFAADLLRESRDE
jgi:hypothetical protein